MARGNGQRQGAVFSLPHICAHVLTGGSQEPGLAVSRSGLGGHVFPSWFLVHILFLRQKLGWAVILLEAV